MRIAAILLFIIAILSLVACTAQMKEAFQTPAPTPALMATEISRAMLFPVAGAFCFGASIVLFVVDFVLRRRRHAEPAVPVE
jgi:hypothetical protein